MGDIIANQDNGGYLRKVTGVTQSGSNTVIQTEQAALNEVYRDMNMSFSTVMIDEKRITQRRGGGFIKRSLTTGNKEITWEEGNLTFSFAPTNDTRQKRVMTPRRYVTGNNTFLKLQTIKESHVLHADGQTPLRFTVTGTTDRNYVRISALELVKVTHPKKRSADNFGARFYGSGSANNRYSGSFQWTPAEDDIDSEGRPYTAIFRVKAYDSSCGTFAWCSKNIDEEMKVNIYLGGEPSTSAEDNVPAVSISGDITASAGIKLEFEPTLQGEFAVKNKKLSEASLYLQGDVKLTADASLIAQGSASAEGEKTLAEKTFYKVYTTPTGIPIVVSATLTIDAKFSASADAKLALESEYTHNFTVKAGFRFNKATERLEEIKDATQSSTAVLKGKANGSIAVRVELIPRLEMRLYEVVALKTKLVPYLYNNTSIAGQYDFLAPPNNGTLCFTEFDNGGGVDLKIRAGVEIFDKGIIGLPSRNPNDYANFVIVPQTSILALPELTSGVTNAIPQSPMDSRAIQIVAEQQSNAVIDPWNGGNWGRVIPNTASLIAGNNENESWVVPTTASGNYSATFWGQNKIGQMGGLAFQLPQCISQAIPVIDQDNDGMADYWEQRYGVDNPDADDDCDGKTNLQEFNAGTYPNDGTCNVSLAVTAPSSNANLPANTPITVSGTATVNTPISITANSQQACSATANSSGSWSCELPSSFAKASTRLTLNVSAVGALTQSLMVNIDAVVTSPTTASATQLNDTGIITCGTADRTSNTADCSTAVAGATGSQVPLGQDGHYGTGINSSTGMSFTKIHGGKCVKDNHTGLMWEVKQGGDGIKGNEGLHDADDTYTWYSDSNNNGRPGYKDLKGPTCHGYDANNESTFCHTQAYVARVNAQGLCGHYNWRLPTHRELWAIVDYSRFSPAIDTTYFPQTKSFVYWSSSPGTVTNESAWGIHFYHGSDRYKGKDDSSHVRLVRGSSDH